ncbi:MAG TPA: hypothetical protein VE074_13885 [Jatrophihabitantaceae bacterium]|nr:hypothetical protein [Jatrophihabitantaceae bacterium]
MWSRDEKLLLGGLGAVGLLFWGRDIKNTVVDVIGRGARLTTTTLDAAGVVQVDPQLLVAQASAVMGRPVSADVLALSRMARSEGIAAGVLRVRVALNDLADLNDRKDYGWSAFDLITYSTDAAARGKFGTQLHRRYASSKDSYQGDVVLVETEMSNGVDNTGGAVKFVDKSSFGVQAGTGSYDALVASWADEGLQPFPVPGYSDDFVVFRRV